MTECVLYLRVTVNPVGEARLLVTLFIYHGIIVCSINSVLTINESKHCLLIRKNGPYTFGYMHTALLQLRFVCHVITISNIRHAIV